MVSIVSVTNSYLSVSRAPLSATGTTMSLLNKSVDEAPPTAPMILQIDDEMVFLSDNSSSDTTRTATTLSADITAASTVWTVGTTANIWASKETGVTDRLTLRVGTSDVETVTCVDVLSSTQIQVVRGATPVSAAATAIVKFGVGYETKRDYTITRGYGGSSAAPHMTARHLSQVVSADSFISLGDVNDVTSFSIDVDDDMTLTRESYTRRALRYTFSVYEQAVCPLVVGKRISGRVYMTTGTGFAPGLTIRRVADAVGVPINEASYFASSTASNSQTWSNSTNSLQFPTFGAATTNITPQKFNEDTLTYVAAVGYADAFLIATAGTYWIEIGFKQVT